MSINNPKDEEVQGAMRSAAVIAVVIGAIVVLVFASNYYSEMRDAKEFDRMMDELYKPHMPLMPRRP